jgi:hypothetical protein
MRAAVFCTPTDRDRTITIQDFTFACAKAETATFEARIRPLQAGDVDCSDPDLDSLHGPGPWDRQGALALGTARARVSVDDGVGACDDGSVSFTLTLAPTPR